MYRFFNMIDTILFENEGQALDYLEGMVLSEDREVDLEPLKERLFDIPQEISPGHYELEGKYGIKVSFDLVNSPNSFDNCYTIFRDRDCIKGDYFPIYSIINLKIQTKNFSYDIKDHPKHTSITWLPNLKSPGSELTHSYVDIGPRRIYLIDETGLFSRPLDLLTYFHELGHLETRSPEQINAENGTIRTTISDAGVETEKAKRAAYNLQREDNANEWMRSNTRSLFEDLGIPSDLMDDYNYKQLESYRALYRWKFFQPE